MCQERGGPGRGLAWDPAMPRMCCVMNCRASACSSSTLRERPDSENTVVKNFRQQSPGAVRGCSRRIFKSPTRQAMLRKTSLRTSGQLGTPQALRLCVTLQLCSELPLPERRASSASSAPAKRDLPPPPAAASPPPPSPRRMEKLTIYVNTPERADEDGTLGFGPQGTADSGICRLRPHVAKAGAQCPEVAGTDRKKRASSSLQYINTQSSQWNGREEEC